MWAQPVWETGIPFDPAKLFAATVVYWGVSFSGLKSINRSCTKHIHNEYNCWIGEKIPQSYARNQKKFKHKFLNDCAPWSMFFPTLRYLHFLSRSRASCQNYANGFCELNKPNLTQSNNIFYWISTKNYWIVSSHDIDCWGKYACQTRYSQKRTLTCVQCRGRWWFLVSK